MSTFNIGETQIYVANPIKPFIAAVKGIAEFVVGLPIVIEILVDWIKGYKYYAIDSAFFNVFPPQTLKAGAIVKVEIGNIRISRKSVRFIRLSAMRL